jgi:hypothetical protein
MYKRFYRQATKKTKSKPSKAKKMPNGLWMCLSNTRIALSKLSFTATPDIPEVQQLLLHFARHLE